MITSDFHMHTEFSHDSKTPVEDMILASIEKGLTDICFTDHYDKDDFGYGAECIFDIDRYFEELPPLCEKYKDQIHVRIGVEIGLQPHLLEFYQQFVKDYPFDFVIGSVHSVKQQDLSCGKNFQDMTDRERFRMIFEEMLLDVQMYGRGEMDTFGHLDYFSRYGKEKEKWYMTNEFDEIIGEILKELIQKDVALELNTAGLKYGLPYAHPKMEVLKMYKDLGGKLITIGADGHIPEYIAYDFQKVPQILAECGFKNYLIFDKRKPKFVEIN